MSIKKKTDRSEELCVKKEKEKYYRNSIWGKQTLSLA
jgi:hypothetical protein